MQTFSCKPIGYIRTPFAQPSGTPIQPVGAKDIEGTVEILPQYAEGLQDISGFSHLVLLYHFHLSKKPSLLVTPFMDKEKRGVFATRAPSRPNPIGLSIVRLTRVEGNILYVLDVDMVDKTPLIDIKPHVSRFHVQEEERIGWLEQNAVKATSKKDDGRFSE